MRLTRLKLINIHASHDYLDEVLERVIELDEFYPEPAQNLVNSVHGANVLDDENPYEVTLKRFLEIGQEMELRLESSPDSKQLELEMMENFMEKNHEKFEEITEIEKEIELLQQEDETLLEQVRNIDQLGIKLKDLFASHYIMSRVGRLPIEGEEKLKFFANKSFIWKTFYKDDTYSWGIYITSKTDRKEIDNIFSSLFFERIFIPGFIEGTPEDAKKNLKEEIHKFQYDLEKLDKRKRDLVEKSNQRYSAFVALLKHLSHVFDGRKYVLDLGETFSITGFIREYQVDHVMGLFKNMKTVEVEVIPPNGDERLAPPKKLNHAWSLRPFGVFIERGKRFGYYKT